MNSLSTRIISLVTVVSFINLQLSPVLANQPSDDPDLLPQTRHSSFAPQTTKPIEITTRSEW